jgi:hypothetical protein
VRPTCGLTTPHSLPWCSPHLLSLSSSPLPCPTRAAAREFPLPVSLKLPLLLPQIRLLGEDSRRVCGIYAILTSKASYPSNLFVISQKIRARFDVFWCSWLKHKEHQSSSISLHFLHSLAVTQLHKHLG